MFIFISVWESLFYPLLKVIFKKTKEEKPAKRGQLNDCSEKQKNTRCNIYSPNQGRKSFKRKECHISQGCLVSWKSLKVYYTWQPSNHWYLCKSISTKWWGYQVQCRIFKNEWSVRKTVKGNKLFPTCFLVNFVLV